MKKINQFIAVIAVAQGVAFTATAANTVDISPVISNGWSGGSENAPSNLWFTLDQSTSMQGLGGGTGLYRMKEGTTYLPINPYSGDAETYRRYRENMKNLASYAEKMIVTGRIPYDPNLTYEIPVDYKGNPLPLPKDVEYTWDVFYTTEHPTVPKAFFNGSQLKTAREIYNLTRNTNKYDAKIIRHVPKPVSALGNQSASRVMTEMLKPENKANSANLIPRDIFMIYAQYNWGVDMCYVPPQFWWYERDRTYKNPTDLPAGVSITDPGICAAPAKVDEEIQAGLNGRKNLDSQEFSDILEQTALKRRITSFNVKVSPSVRFDEDLATRQHGLGSNEYPYTWYGLIPKLRNLSGGSLVKADKTCERAANQRNCQIWKTFYSNRLLALKSGLSLALYRTLVNEDGTYKNIRYGYQPFHKYYATRGGGAAYVTHQIATKFNTPNTTDLKVNNEKNLKELYEWLFTFTTESYGTMGTPLRISVADLLRDIKRDAKNGKIFLEDPQKPYDKDTNKKFTCRQNHNVMFTDGGWNGNIDRVVSNPLAGRTVVGCQSPISCQWGNANSNIAYTNQTTESSFPLKDGTQYQAMAPFKATNPSLAGSMSHLADMAFRAWITDLDDNDANNSGDGAVVVTSKRKKYIDENGNMKVYENNNSPYWHPFYDLAKWQHINTHAVGFGLSEERYSNININPPTTVEQAKNLFKMTFTPTDAYGNPTGAASTVLNLMDGDKIQRTIPRSSYSIGGLNAITDMARAAMTGRGLFFNAKSGKGVVDAFTAIIERAGEQAREDAATTGGAGTSASSRIDGNTYYSTRYNSNSFTGELIRRQLYNGGNAQTCFVGCSNGTEPACLNHQLGDFCTRPAGSWNAARLLTANQRQIITAKRQVNSAGAGTGTDLTPAALAALDGTQNLSYAVTNFNEGNLSDYQKQQLLTQMPEVMKQTFTNQDKQLTKLYDYVHGFPIVKSGTDLEAKGVVRNRNKYTYGNSTTEVRNILGAIVRSSPVYAGRPHKRLAHLDDQRAAYQNYQAIIEDYADGSIDNVVFIGANDGMVHAFKADDGEELFAYVPASLYGRLPQTVVPDQQLSLIDGKLRVEWINFGGHSNDDTNTDWQQILVGGFGGGAQGIYSLNVSKPEATAVKAATKGNWEYGALESRLYNKKHGNLAGKSNIGNIMGQVDLIQLQDNTWATVVGNGYNSESGKAALIVINAETGQPIQELVLDSTTTDGTYADGKPNGLGPVFFANFPKAGVSDLNKIDRAYAGDLQGNLWVFDLSKANKDGGIEVANKRPLFIAKDKDGNRQPITASPRVVPHPTGYGFLVHFGTGALFSVHDLSSKVTNSIYAIWDDWTPEDKNGLPRPRTTTVTANELNKIELIYDPNATVQNEAGITQTIPVRYLSADAQKTEWRLNNGDHRGWEIELLPGERAWQTSQMVYGQASTEVLNYKTIRYLQQQAAQQCGGGSAGVEGWSLAFFPADASRRLSRPGLDANGNGRITALDAVNVSGQGSGSGATLNPTGVGEAGTFGYASTSQVSQGGKAGDSCKDLITLSSNSKSELTKQQLEACAYISSWKELR
ncbi:MAG: hypothetical protein CR974_02535 [Gammaproteobacteria bacterium]|nr:MAG: hypothetical protein CR974_02535 [Gammaproteobacteria bacterium]